MSWDALNDVHIYKQCCCSGNEFTVTNIDADELRKSQRKKKPPQIMIQPTATSTYGSNDSEDDEDEVFISCLHLF